MLQRFEGNKITNKNEKHRGTEIQKDLITLRKALAEVNHKAYFGTDDSCNSDIANPFLSSLSIEINILAVTKITQAIRNAEEQFKLL
jgi:hypothetical protein